MTSLIYDGSFEGMLTAVFEIYDRKLDHTKLQKGQWLNSAWYEDVIHIVTDKTKATRVLNGLNDKLTADGLQRIYMAHISEIENAEQTLIGYIRYAFDSGQNIEKDYSNPHVLKLSEIIQKVRRERHRMEAFIRFQKLTDGTFYAA